MIPGFDPEQEPKALIERYDSKFLVTGNYCHLALYKAADNNGRLLACIHHHINCRNQPGVLPNHSHMVYQSPEGAIWDIYAPETDERWIGQFTNADVPDEDNLLSIFEWLLLRADEIEASVDE